MPIGLWGILYKELPFERKDENQSEASIWFSIKGKKVYILYYIGGDHESSDNGCDRIYWNRAL